MKKILFVLNNMNIGGTEKAFLNMVDRISREEYDITLLLLEKSGGFLKMVPEWVHIEVLDGYENMKAEIMDPPLQVALKYLKQGRIGKAVGLSLTHLFFKMTGDRSFYYRYVLKGKKNRELYDTAIAYCGPFDFLTVYVLYCVNAVKKIQWVHFDVSKFQFNINTCKKLYLKFQQIYVVSEEARIQLVKKIPGISNITKTCLNVLSSQKCKELAVQGEGFNDDYTGIRIVTIGRLSEEKGQDIIPEVAERLRNADIEFRWYLIGDGKLRNKIEEQIQVNGVDKQVQLMGTQTNPYQFLKDANIYVQTSRHEGYCITLAEARVFDLPIVSTECAGAHEQLDNREECYVVNRTADEIFNAIMKILFQKNNLERH